MIDVTGRSRLTFDSAVCRGESLRKYVQVVTTHLFTVLQAYVVSIAEDGVLCGLADTMYFLIRDFKQSLTFWTIRASLIAA